MLLPPQPADDSGVLQHRSIIAIKVTEREVLTVAPPLMKMADHSTAVGSPSPDSAAAEAAAVVPFQFPSPTPSPAPAAGVCRFGEHVLRLDQWYSFLSPEYAFTRHSADLAAMPSIINLPSAEDAAQQLAQEAAARASSASASDQTQDLLRSKALVFISGLAMNDDNPAPGSGIARALRQASTASSEQQPRAAPYAVHLVGVDYSLGSAGVECEALDESLVVDSWESVSVLDHTRDVLRRLAADPLAFWIPASDCETALLAKGLHLLRRAQEKALLSPSVAAALAVASPSVVDTPDPSASHPSPAPRDWSAASSRVLIPPFSALELTAKPCLEVARMLGMDVPPTLLIDRASRTGAALSLHTLLAFTASQRGPYWVKGEVFGACLARHYSDAARAIGGMQAAVDQAVLIQLGVQGLGRGVAFAAVDGVLTGAIGFTKSQSTALLKGWSGVLESVEPALLERIEGLVRCMNYTGGGELEFVEGLDGRRAFIDFNARFPAWISASALAGINLPAALVQHALHDYSKQHLSQQSTPTSSDPPLFKAEVPFPSACLALSRLSRPRVHFTLSLIHI